MKLAGMVRDGSAVFFVGCWEGACWGWVRARTSWGWVRIEGYLVIDVHAACRQLNWLHVLTYVKLRLAWTNIQQQYLAVSIAFPCKLYSGETCIGMQLHSRAS